MNEDKFVIYDHLGQKQELGNLDYLNYLCDRSRSLIKDLHKPNIRFLIWDFEELKEYSFFRPYYILIDSQIGSLKRVLSCELIHKI